MLPLPMAGQPFTLYSLYVELDQIHPLLVCISPYTLNYLRTTICGVVAFFIHPAQGDGSAMRVGVHG